MVCDKYCAPYPKQPCVVHEINMWCPCCMTSFVLEFSTTFFQVSWFVLWLSIKWLMWWRDWSTLNLVVLKIENRKINRNKNRNKKKNKINQVYLLWSWHQYFVNSSLQGPRDKLSMDWSADVPEIWSSSIPHISPAGENMLLPCILLPNRDVRGKRRVESNNSGPSVLNYGNNQLTILSS